MPLYAQLDGRVLVFGHLNLENLHLTMYYLQTNFQSAGCKSLTAAINSLVSYGKNTHFAQFGCIVTLGFY